LLLNKKAKSNSDWPVRLLHHPLNCERAFFEHFSPFTFASAKSFSISFNQFQMHNNYFTIKSR